VRPCLDCSVSSKIFAAEAQFNLRTVHMEFLVSEVALGRIYLRAFRFPPANCHSTDAPYQSIIRGAYIMSIRGRSTKGLNPTLSSYMISNIIHETAICRNPRIHNFRVNRENVADPQETNTYACYIFKKM
jgi:hypothetical protein